MPRSYCRAKNPAACRSPRCPSRRGSSVGGSVARTASRAGKTPASTKQAPREQREVRAASRSGSGSTSRTVSTLSARVAEIAARIDDGPVLSHAALLEAEGERSSRLVEQLSAEQRKALFDYTNQEYSHLNYTLRRGDELDEGQRDLVEHLDTVFAQFGSGGSVPRRLYRSISPPDSALPDTRAWVAQQFPVGKVVRSGAYVSTTVSETSLVAMLRERPPTPENFLWGTREEWETDVEASVARNVVLEVVSRDGLSVSSLSHMPQELEVLLPRSGSFYVASVDETVYENDVHILDGTELGDTKRYPAVRVRLVDVDLLK